MMICCRACHWSQDDFWDDSYNPVKCAQNDAKDIAEMMSRDPMDRTALFDIGFLRDRQIQGTPSEDRSGMFSVDYQELLARRFEELARRVRGMKWWTYRDYQNDPDPRCPVCCGNNLSID